MLRLSWSGQFASTLNINGSVSCAVGYGILTRKNDHHASNHGQYNDNDLGLVADEAAAFAPVGT